MITNLPIRISILAVLFCFGEALFAQPGTWNGYAPPVSQQKNVSEATVAEPSGNGQVDYLYLKTGFLVEGVATNDGKNYTVKMEFGSMQISADKVEYIGRDRHEIYEYRRNLIDGGSCQDVRKFAEWCLGNGLVKEGIEEYQRAKSLAPNETMATFIQQCIDIAQHPETGKVDIGNNPFMSPLANDRKLNSVDSDPEIGRWMSGMPRNIVDSFSRKVQPILTSRCAAADCHGSASENQFRISIPRHQNGSTTYRNLQAALHWIDPANPSGSPLLAAMVSHHGGTKPPFDVESNQYAGTVQWIQSTLKELPGEYSSQLYSGKQPMKIAATTPPVNPSPAPVPQPTVKPNPTPVPQPNPASKTFFAENDPRPVEFAPTKLSVPPQPNTPQPPVAPAPSNDPLDPARFNALYHGK